MGILPIGFFAPLPLAIMIPFMAAQSFAMGHAFGTSFQYGKRKISSMTNEEFNALSATDLHGNLQADIRAMIPNMNQSFKTMEQFQIDIINSMVNTLRLAGQQFFEWITTGKVTETTQTSFEGSESASDVFYGGSITIPNTLLNEATPEAIIEKLAKDYMEETGLADFERAKIIIKRNQARDLHAKQSLERDIQASRDAAAQVKTFIPKDTSIRPGGATTGQFKSPAQHAATAKANKAALVKNIASQQGRVTLKALEVKRMAAYVLPRVKLIKSGRIRASVATANKLLRGLQILRNVLANEVKKLANLKTQLRNYR